MGSLLQKSEQFWAAAVELAWGMPLAVLLIAAGVWFSVYGRFTPVRKLRHAIEVIRGRYDDPNDPGEISHFQALSSALSATLGMGNIAGVAIAVTVGGPGAVFWMWIVGLVGMATKYFTCTLSCLYRKKDSKGVVQGGPMYWIEIGLGPRWKPLGLMFAVFGMIGCLPMFQINQLAHLLEESWSVPPLATGSVVTILVGVVILGGIVRVGKVAAKVVPAMALLYFASALFIVVQRLDVVPGILASIIGSAFTGGAAIGGAAGVTIREAMIVGVKRAAFSNEAGMGTAPLAHGAAKTDEPVREGLTAMLGPFIDTNIVCTLTALVILSSGVAGSEEGVVLTAMAFETAMPRVGPALLTLIIVLFSVSTMMSYSYYSQKCAKYVLGETWGARYEWVYLLSIVCGALWTQAMVLNMLDTAFAMMSIPTVVSTLWLSPKVMAATRDYFARMDGAEPDRRIPGGPTRIRGEGPARGGIPR